MSASEVMSANPVPHAAPAPWAADVSAETYVERARALLPLLRQHAAAADAARSVPPEVVAAMKQAGLFRILQPSRLGGAELGMKAMHDVVRTLSAGSSAASWLLMVLSAHTWILGMFSEAAQDEIAADDPGHAGLRRPGRRPVPRSRWMAAGASPAAGPSPAPATTRSGT